MIRALFGMPSLLRYTDCLDTGATQARIFAILAVQCKDIGVSYRMHWEYRLYSINMAQLRQIENPAE